MNNKNWVPLPYQVILKILSEKGYKQEIEVKKAKVILTHRCRIPKNLVTATLNEMKEKGWI